MTDDYLPQGAIAEVLGVLEWGERHKHAGDGFADERTLSHHVGKARGHIVEHESGRRSDPETGRSPLAHATARLLLALERELRGLP